MSESNGNGNEKILNIDVTDEHAFRTGVVQTLQFIVDRTADLPALKKKVEKHEQIVKFGKWLSVPTVAAISGGVKYFFAKIGL